MEHRGLKRNDTHNFTNCCILIEIPYITEFNYVANRLVRGKRILDKESEHPQSAYTEISSQSYITAEYSKDFYVRKSA